MILAREVLNNGGKLKPLIHNSITADKSFPTIMNPSVYIDKGRILCNIRNVNYLFWHNEQKQVFNGYWGPLSYLHPENDSKLRTRNWLCYLNNNLDIEECFLIDTTLNDVEPLWTFVGLEDGRLVRWEDKLFLSGVRRDTTYNGQGRMELSEIYYNSEIERLRIEVEAESYCEKNWMPILDMPYHYIRWVNPLQIVKVNGTTYEKVLEQSYRELDFQHRGGSQVITVGDYYVCITHSVAVFSNELNQKDGKYLHRFFIWNKNWELVWCSIDFSFMSTLIEFCCGLALKDDTLLASFGVDDNCAFILEIPLKWLENLSNLKLR